MPRYFNVGAFPYHFSSGVLGTNEHAELTRKDAARGVDAGVLVEVQQHEVEPEGDDHESLNEES